MALEFLFSIISSTAGHRIPPGAPTSSRHPRGHHARNVCHLEIHLRQFARAEGHQPAWVEVMKFKHRFGAPAKPLLIKLFENRYGIVLPEDYRKFLAPVNGGRPEEANCVFRFINEAGSTTESVVHGLYGLVKEDGPSQLDWNIEIFRSRIPNGMIPIGEDPFGNQILLEVSKPSHVGLWFWDHEKEPDTIDDSGIYRISDSFDQFVESLTPLVSE